VRELIDLLAEYPDETPVFDGKGYDLSGHVIRDMKYDIWGVNPDEDGYEVPAVGIGVAIGPRL
jgi:hypothetical protein